MSGDRDHARVLAALAVTGTTSAWNVGGAIALAATYLIGTLLGTSGMA